MDVTESQNACEETLTKLKTFLIKQHFLNICGSRAPITSL